MIRRATVAMCVLVGLFQQVATGQLSVTATAVAGAGFQSGDLAAVCRSVWGVRADGTNLKEFPASIPAPPAGARRCGARESQRAVYYVWDVPSKEILVHWEAALKRQGFRTQRVGGKTPDREFVRFSGPLGGKISLSPRGGGFVIALGGSL